MTSTQLQPVPDAAPFTSAAALQGVLPKLVALSLHAKQAHWNTTGPAFLPLHALTDDIARDARSWADRVAERAAALGFSVDARAATVATVAGQFPAGHLADHEAISELIAQLNDVALAARRALHDLDQTDPVAYDLTVEVLEGIEKYRWMLRAQFPGESRLAASDPPDWSQLASPTTNQGQRRRS